MEINATLINLYHVCARECWLHSNGIRMEHTSDIVYDGKLLHETSYLQRANRYTEVSLSSMFNGITLTGKIDFYDPQDKIVHETKRSDTVERAHEWQLKYYLWLFELVGIIGVSGILEYPRLRQTKKICFLATDRAYLQQVVDNICALKLDKCPQKIHKKICKSCSYHDLCYINDA